MESSGAGKSDIGIRRRVASAAELVANVFFEIVAAVGLNVTGGPRDYVLLLQWQKFV